MFEISYCDEGNHSFYEKTNLIITYLVIDAAFAIDYLKKEHLDDRVVDSPSCGLLLIFVYFPSPLCSIRCSSS